MIRVPLTVGRRDVVVGLADPDLTIGEAIAAIPGLRTAPSGVDFPTVVPTALQTDPAAVDGIHVGARICAGDVTVRDARLRPGDVIGVTAAASPAPVPTLGWAVHVIAGLDAGRVVPMRPTATDGWVATVGRSSDVDVRLASNGVSNHHCTLTVDGSRIRIVDHSSRNGTIVRGHRCGPDGVDVDFGEPVGCGPTVVVVRAVPAADTPVKVDGLLRSSATGPVPYYRSPVDLPPAPGPDIELPAPPRQPKTGRPGLIGFLLPMAMAAGMVWFTGQWLYAMFALMGPVMMLVTTADRAGRNRRVRKTSKRRYRQELVEFADDLDEARDLEVRRRREISPDLAEIVRRADVASAALWSRRRNHPHFMTLSLGIADTPWEAPLAEPPDELADLIQLVDAGRTLHHAPVAIEANAGTTLGLAGPRHAALATARGLLAQAAGLHGPAEIRMILVVGRERAADWDWTKWLPHVRPSFAGGRLLAVVADEDGWVDAAAIDDVLADSGAGADLVAVIDTHGLADNGDLAVRRLLRMPVGIGDEGGPIGSRRAAPRVTGIVLADTADGLPDLCDLVVTHHDADGEATSRWPRDPDRNTELVVGGLSAVTADRFARSLARLVDPDAGGGSASLPTCVSHAEILGLDQARPADVTARWTLRPSGALVVGVGESGTVAVDLDTDGPHAVVVGGRGTGKTEHLAAMVFDLAASRPPEQLHVVLWGESFGHLHRLPHVASAVSRIDETTLGQFVDGLDRELSRRERLRSQRVGQPGDTSAGASADAVSTGTGEPRLVVVIDDVDTINRVIPAATEGLIRLLRRARGLGVNVLWSTSRHSGGAMNELVDLSSIRVVLRVASAPDSNDLLGSDAAALLERSLPGRGYVVAGRSELREVQGGAVSVGAPRPVGPIEIAPFDLPHGRAGFSAAQAGPPDERALLDLIAAAGATSMRPPDLLSTKADAVTALHSPGLFELLGINDADDLATVTDRWHTIDHEGLLRVPIGVDPEMRPIALDVKESALAGMGPHGLLVGATGAGKSELLRTLVAGLALTHSPEVLSFVLVDFKGGASFASLGALPHVAGVVTNLADDLALVDRILAALGGEQRRRQELLAAAGNLGNVREYRAARRAGTLPPELGDQPLPTLLVIVDEFAELLDQEPAFIDFFLTIGRVGRSLGIHLLLASQRLEEGKLRGLDTYLSYRLGLRTFSAAESRIVLGVPDAFSLPSAPGGGYLKVGSTSFERFQASYVSGPLGPAFDQTKTEPAHSTADTRAAPDAGATEVSDKIVNGAVGEMAGRAAGDVADGDGSVRRAEFADGDEVADEDGAADEATLGEDLADGDGAADEVTLGDELADGSDLNLAPNLVRDRTVLDAVIDRLVDAAEPVHQIWLPPMANEIALDPLFGQGFVRDESRGFAANGWPGTAALAIPVGVVDEPARQQQLPLILDFAGAHGNLAIAGAPQSGKSLFLRTMLLSLAVTHTPNEVQVYGIDYGGGTLEAMAGLPHVGTVATRQQPDLVARLVSHVSDILDQREAMFSAQQIDSVATFRRRRATGALADQAGTGRDHESGGTPGDRLKVAPGDQPTDTPDGEARHGDVFLIIDGWAAFREKFEVLEPVIADIASRGLGYGVHVIVTVNRWMEMRANVLDAIGGRLELRLNSALDSAFDRRRAAVIRADQPGRGLHPSTLLFHIALPRLDGQHAADTLPAATRAAVDHIRDRWAGPTAAPVVLLPSVISTTSLPPPAASVQERTRADVPVGLLERGMATWNFGLTGSEPHFFVYGDGESGKTTFLRTWLLGLTDRTTPDEAAVVLVDYRRSLLGVVPDTHLHAYAASEPATRDVIAEVAEIATSRLPGADVTAAELRTRSWWTGPELYVVVDDYDLVVTPAGSPIAALLPLLAQGRDVGLHVVLARRVAGATKMMYEPITSRIREVSSAGLVLSGEREEGPIIGSVRASPQPPGRGVLMTRHLPPSLVQVAIDERTTD